MMTYDHWKAQTKRGLTTPRGKALVDLDLAFQAYQAAKTTKNLTALFNALIVWIEQKGVNWRNSTRNSKLEDGGVGTVEKLLKDLLAENPAFRGKAAPWLAPQAPRVPLMEHGARNEHRDEDGHHYQLVVQNKENSCGPASIRIVIKLVKNEDCGEDYLRELVEQAEEGGGYGGSLGGGGVVVSGGAHDWDPTGGGTWLVPAALQAAKIKCTQGPQLSPLRLTTSKKPAIAVVSWAGGAGLHYVVVAGRTKAAGKLVVLDPFYGLQYAPFPPTLTSHYQPVDAQGHVLATPTGTNGCAM